MSENMWKLNQDMVVGVVWRSCMHEVDMFNSTQERLCIFSDVCTNAGGH